MRMGCTRARRSLSCAPHDPNPNVLQQNPAGPPCTFPFFTLLLLRVLWSLRPCIPFLLLARPFFLLLARPSVPRPSANASSRPTSTGTQNVLDSRTFIYAPNFIRTPHHKDIEHPKHLHKSQAHVGSASSCAAGRRARTKIGSVASRPLPRPLAFRHCQSPTTSTPASTHPALLHMHPHTHTDACLQYEVHLSDTRACRPLLISRLGSASPSSQPPGGSTSEGID